MKKKRNWTMTLEKRKNNRYLNLFKFIFTFFPVFFQPPLLGNKPWAVQPIFASPPSLTPSQPKLPQDKTPKPNLWFFSFPTTESKEPQVAPKPKSHKAHCAPTLSLTRKPNRKSQRTQGALIFSCYSFSVRQSLLLQTTSRTTRPLDSHLHGRFPQQPNLRAVVRSWFLRPWLLSNQTVTSLTFEIHFSFYFFSHI